MTKDEAQKLAKELDGVIADVEEGDGFDDVCLGTVKYVRDTLVMAQPEQEPVAWGMMNDDGKIYDCICPEEHDRVEGEYSTPLYTTPPHRKPLTDEEIADIVVEMNGNEPTALFWRDLARAIEAAHGIKE